MPWSLKSFRFCLFLILPIFNFYSQNAAACEVYETIQATICEGQSYDIDTLSFTESGEYEIRFVSELGCDSIISLNLTVLESIESALAVTICEGQSYDIDTLSFTESGEYEIRLVSELGCDSIVHLNLSVIETVESALAVTICEGQSYDLDTLSFTESGEYEIRLVSELGCDSVVHLNLSVIETVESALAVTICEGQSYDIDTLSFTESGEYEIRLVSELGCDSIVHLNLSVIETVESALAVTICEGQSYDIDTLSFTESGEYEVRLVSESGCDSIVHLNLSVIEAVESALAVTICEGQSYDIDTLSFTESGEYQIRLVSELGCDSIVHLNLSIIETVESALAVTICEGQSFDIDTLSFSESGEYEIRLVSELGCDSIVHLNLSVIEAVESALAVTICEGQSFDIDTLSFSESGEYEIRLVSESGCDSIVHLNLSVMETVESALAVTICEGQSYDIDTLSFTESGEYEIRLVSESGCDSTVFLSLTVTDRLETYLNETICSGQSFTIDTLSFNESGNYEIQLRSSVGCDSIVFLSLTVTDLLVSYLDEVICSGQSFEIDTLSFSESGEFEVRLKSSVGCDSLVNLSLTVMDSIVTELSESVCEGSSFQVGHEVFSEAGDYVVSLPSSQGCDSTVYLSLTIFEISRKNINVTVCEGQSYVLGDSIYTKAGNYSQILTSSFGCDSIIYLNLEISLSSRTELKPVICRGDTFKVGRSVYSESGTYNDTLTNNLFCDSIVTTFLTVMEPTVEQLAVAVCEGQSYTVGQNTYSQSGLYRDTLQSVYGCDSIIVLRLSVQNQITVEQDVSICLGQQYEIANSRYEETGTYLDTLVSFGGCDSIVTTHLKVRPVFNLEYSTSICEGDSIIFGNQVVREAGTYTSVFQTDFGCDSTVSLSVSVLPIDFNTVHKQSCEGESVVINEKEYWQDTTLSIVMQNQFGCDSTVRYLLKFYPKFHEQVFIDICEGGEYQGVVIKKDTVLTFNLISSYGCDSITDVFVTVGDLSVNSKTVKICYGGTYRSMKITRDTVLVAHLTNIYGCDSIVIDSVFVLPELKMTVSSDTLIRPGSLVTLFASGASSYMWSTGQTNPAIVITPTESTVYTVTGTSREGCTETKEIKVSLTSCNLEIPNYFTPNQDGVHDIWNIKGLNCLSGFELKIINRWGSVVFQTQSPNTGWDGLYKDKPAPEGVYFYVLEGISFEHTQTMRKSGYIHLER